MRSRATETLSSLPSNLARLCIAAVFALVLLVEPGDGSLRLGSTAIAGPRLCLRIHDKVRSRRTNIANTVVEWSQVISLGVHEKLLIRDRIGGPWKIRVLQSISHSRTVSQQFADVELMPGAHPADHLYYAVFSLDNRSGRLKGRLYGINSLNDIADSQNQRYELTWRTYQRTETVTDREIQQFKDAEDQLSPLRKITFFNSYRKGKAKAVVRVFDGSPVPVTFLTEFPYDFAIPRSDPRIPIELRYPQLRLRTDTQYVFEPGRLAKEDNVTDVLPYQLYAMAQHFLHKFGARMVAPSEYVHKGLIYAEVTGRHLKAYIGENGMGWELFAMARSGGPMQEVRGSVKYESLNVDASQTNDKFVIRMRLIDFISRFGQEVKTAPAAEVYPEAFKD